MTLSLAGQSLELRPSGAVILGDALVVADLHLGKERAFRQQGVPVPDGPSADTLATLSKEICAANVQRLVFLGDLFHHENAIAGITIESLLLWLQRHPGLQATLVKGNHDRIPPALQMAIETVPSLAIGGLSLFHHPQDPNIPHLAGHLHPCISLSQGKQSHRLRCFWRHAQSLILPAFGEFTGCALIDPTPGDDVFVFTGSKVSRLPIS